MRKIVLTIVFTLLSFSLLSVANSEDRYLNEKLEELTTMKESSRFPLLDRLDRLQTYLENVRKLDDDKIKNVKPITANI